MYRAMGYPIRRDGDLWYVTITDHASNESREFCGRDIIPSMIAWLDAPLTSHVVTMNTMLATVGHGSPDEAMHLLGSGYALDDVLVMLDNDIDMSLMDSVIASSSV